VPDTGWYLSNGRLWQVRSTPAPLPPQVVELVGEKALEMRSHDTW
jgi:hypothetical protein